MEKNVKKESDRRQIAINMIANIISYSANMIISFVLTPYLINVLGKETYSFYPMANQIVSYLSVLTNSMNAMASRFVTVSLVKENGEEANRYYSSATFSNILIGGILCIPMALIVLFLERFMDVPINSMAAIKTLYTCVFASTLVSIITSTYGIATFAKNRIDLRSFRELVAAILKLALYVVLYSVLPPSIIYVGIVSLAVVMVNTAFQIFYTKKLLPEIHISRHYVSKKHTIEMLSSSAWNAINSFGNILLVGTSMMLANVLYGAEASGIYSIVQTVPQFINGVISMLVGIFYPVITYKYAQKDYKGLVREIHNAQTLVGMCGCAVISVFSALASQFFSLWTPGEDAGYLAVLSFLTILPHFVISCVWSLTNLNVVMNKVKIPAIYTLASGVANVTLACLGFKLFKFDLIALPIISSVLQLFWVGVFIPLYACRNLGVKWHTFYQVVAKAIFCSATTMIVIAYVKQFFVLNSWLRFILFGGICGICALLWFAIIMMGIKNVFAKVKEKILYKTQ